MLQVSLFIYVPMDEPPAMPDFMAFTPRGPERGIGMPDRSLVIFRVEPLVSDLSTAKRERIHSILNHLRIITLWHGGSIELHQSANESYPILRPAGWLRKAT